MIVSRLESGGRDGLTQVVGRLSLSAAFLDHGGGNVWVDSIQGYNVTILFMLYMPNGLIDEFVRLFVHELESGSRRSLV